MPWAAVLLYFAIGLLLAMPMVALHAWVSRLADRARVPSRPRAERWLSTGLTITAGGLLGWGASSGRSWAVELSGTLVALLAWQVWRRRRIQAVAGTRAAGSA